MEIISVGIGESRQTAGHLADYVGAKFSVVPDPDRAIAAAYRVDGTPETVIIGRSGNIEQTVDGYGPDILDQAVEKVMGST